MFESRFIYKGNIKELLLTHYLVIVGVLPMILVLKTFGSCYISLVSPFLAFTKEIEGKLKKLN
jgi:hypothetical protein